MSPKPMLRRRDFWLLLGACVALLLLVPVVRHYQLRAAARAYVAQLRAQGEKLDLAEVMPPPVPPEQDSSAVFFQVEALLNSPDYYEHTFVLTTNPPKCRHIVAPGRAQVGWKLPAVVDGLSSNSWAEVETELAQNSAVLTLLRRLPLRATCNFNLPSDWRRAFEQAPLLGVIRDVAPCLSAAVLVELHHSDTEAAARDVRAMLAVANGMADERLAISEGMRIAVTARAGEATWELLQATNVTDAELSCLQQAWAGLVFFQAGEEALLVERASVLTELAAWRQAPIALRAPGGSPGYWNWNDLWSRDRLPVVLRQMKQSLDLLQWRYWGSYEFELKTFQSEQALLETYRQAHTNASLLALAGRLNSRLESIVNETSVEPILHEFDNLALIDLWGLRYSSAWHQRKIFNGVLDAETSRRITITAITLKRYQLKHGKFPETLKDLTPEFLPAELLDPMSGQPFHYRREGAEGFLLYSVGKDGVDDRGDASNGSGSKSMYWLQDRDWVWPQPGR